VINLPTIPVVHGTFIKVSFYHVRPRGLNRSAMILRILEWLQEKKLSMERKP